MQLRLIMAGVAAGSVGLIAGWALVAAMPGKQAAPRRVVEIMISGPSVYVAPRAAPMPSPAPPAVGEETSKPVVVPAASPAPTAVPRGEETPKPALKTPPTPVASRDKQRIRTGWRQREDDDD
jgi:hypothetical protein